ncbi:acetate--CoA ligase family protein [Escherichia coli]
MHVAEQIGYPVALKLRSPDIPHKWEVQGVMLYLRTANEVQASGKRYFRSRKNGIAARGIHGLLVRSWLTGLALGVAGCGNSADPVFGPFNHAGVREVWSGVLKSSRRRTAAAEHEPGPLSGYSGDQK